MAQTKKFNRDVVVERAMAVFEKKGCAEASTADLLQAMKIGRQSLYDTFGDKRGLFLEALRRNQDKWTVDHIARLRSAPTPLGGIEAMLAGAIGDIRGSTGRAFLAVVAMTEFGERDREVTRRLADGQRRLHQELVDHLKRAKAVAELWQSVDPESAASFLETTMYGFHVAARAGMSADALRAMVKYAVRSVTR